MGNRFYEQQKKVKPGRKLKKDVIVEFERAVNQHVPGLDRMTIANIENLLRIFKER